MDIKDIVCIFEYDGSKLPDNIDNFKQIEQFKNYKCRVGDIIWCCDDYRDVETHIVSVGGKLIKNPNKTNTGRLTIPFEITKYLENPKEFYKPYIDDIDVIEV